jgi:hypothetical protein
MKDLLDLLIEARASYMMLCASLVAVTTVIIFLTLILIFG